MPYFGDAGGDVVEEAHHLHHRLRHHHHHHHCLHRRHRHHRGVRAAPSLTTKEAILIQMDGTSLFALRMALNNMP